MLRSCRFVFGRAENVVHGREESRCNDSAASLNRPDQTTCGLIKRETRTKEVDDARRVAAYRSFFGSTRSGPRLAEPLLSEYDIRCAKFLLLKKNNTSL